MKHRPPCWPRREAGFTFLGLLLAVALLGVGLAAASEVWVTTAQRQRAEQSRWAAQEFVRAIGSYYESGPAGVKRFPASVDDLLEDRRGGWTRRHLRQLYLNPHTGSRDWEWLRSPDGGIRGVKTGSEKKEWGGPPESTEWAYVPEPPRP